MSPAREALITFWGTRGSISTPGRTTEKYGGKSIEEIVRETLYRFCQGMKVCVEIVLMAADAGLIPLEGDIISVAGTGEGADTAIVVKPSYSRKFCDLIIREIIAKPR